MSADDSSRDILTLPPPPADHRIAYGTDPNQFGDLRLPAGPGPHPVVIVIHGGYWRAAYDLAYAGHMAAAITRLGFATWNIEYRRVGQPGGGYPGTLDDVAAAAAHLSRLAEAHKLDLRTVIAVGHSAGGHLALWLGVRNKVTAAISLAGIPDLREGFARNLSNGAVRELLGCAPEDCPDRYRAASPRDQLPSRTPLALIHGEADRIVPIALSRDFAFAPGARASYKELTNTGHFELVDPRTPQWRSVETAIRAAAR